MNINSKYKTAQLDTIVELDIRRRLHDGPAKT